MRLHFCGVRGSVPVSGPDFVKVGGNTSCVAISHDEESAPRLVIDAGTGLRAVTDLLHGEPFRGTLLLSHLHWDHTQGLPFFSAIDRPDASARLLVPAQGEPAVELLERFMSPPSFPIRPSGLLGRIAFESLDDGCHAIEGFDLVALDIPHTAGRTFGFRVSDAGSTIAYLSDHGPAMLGTSDDERWGPYHPAALELAAGADVLIHDAQYTCAELPSRLRFGHSAIDYAVELGRRCGVGQVVLFHHDPSRTDAEVQAIERSYVAHNPLVRAAREGATMTVP